MMAASSQCFNPLSSPGAAFPEKVFLARSIKSWAFPAAFPTASLKSLAESWGLGRGPALTTTLLRVKAIAATRASRARTLLGLLEKIERPMIVTSLLLEIRNCCGMSALSDIALVLLIVSFLKAPLYIVQILQKVFRTMREKQ